MKQGSIVGTVPCLSMVPAFTLLSEPDFYIELCVLTKYIAIFVLVHARDKEAIYFGNTLYCMLKTGH